MSDQALAAITSLSASVASLQTQVSALSCQVATKADATAASALTNGIAEARPITSLTSRVTSCEPADLLVDAGQAVQPLRMGKVIFHGETARQIRVAQTVLSKEGAGQLEVVKRANEPGEPFVVIDGQVFIAKSTVENSAIDPSKFQIKFNLNTDPQLHLGSHLVDAVRNLLGDELKPGGMLHRR